VVTQSTTSAPEDEDELELDELELEELELEELELEEELELDEPRNACNSRM
jgi:hypothetical protein